ncbi:tripartite tricarboxylate transporter substrate binding protein [Aquabacterium sp. J223]|uniref:Bug family tripartite tricarboxylate transporter substrate binding protein n=1 Tax=Aquabacterium sp. J223 TaxID=2898431 RepID=UPI0021AD9F3D|nr:tripartite tricarboxylate transporter substrate binding protein [Aquabacterium sp. J223]UUX95452.1 tripartite tricarboxylate transporter substrate binding protein [Aquabacterium sp. J223]
MHAPKRRRALAAAAVLAAAALPAAALAQAGGTARPIRLVVVNPPGGLTDTVARLLAPRLQEALGTTIVIDNKPGANGGVGAASLAASPADGTSFLLADGSLLSVNPLTSRKLAYDPKKDLVPVSLVARAPLFLAVNANVKAQTLEELVALAKAQPGRLNYGSSGIGSTHHLTMEALKAEYGLFITHIPFRGSAASVPALLGGQVDMVFSAYPSLAGFVRSGQVRLLATNASHRSPLAPQVPAIAEKRPGFDFAPIVILMAQHGTPPEAMQRMSEAIARIARRPDAGEQAQGAGIEMVGGGPAELAQALDAEIARMQRVAQRADLKSE